MSVAVKRNTYVHAIKFVSIVATSFALPRVYIEGPDTLDRVVFVTMPSLSVAIPARFTELLGNVIVLSAPAFTVGS